MKMTTIALAALLVHPVAAAAAGHEMAALTAAGSGAAPAQVLAITGYLSAWTQDCQGASCALPAPGERNRPVLLRLVMPSAPGEASAAHASETLSLGAAGEILAEINFYAICPYGGAPGTCAGRYFQAQVSLSGPAGAFCAAAFNAPDFAPFPVLMCAGTSAAGRRFGVTLHRRTL